jgi:hypothetical protein
LGGKYLEKWPFVHHPWCSRPSVQALRASVFTAIDPQMLFP